MLIRKEILLSEYLPKSELVVEKSDIKKPRFPVIDIHTHYGALLLGEHYEDVYDTAEQVEYLKQQGVRHIVNLDGLWGAELDRMLAKIHPYEDFILTFGTVDVTRLDERDFESYVKRTVKESKERGIKGLKFLKNVSLSLKDSNNKYIPVDDRRLKVIWETAAELDLPVLIHIADPTAFFKPIDEHNERYEELRNNPEWSFYGPQFFSFEQLMEMQENLLTDNPRTTFIVAHVGSYSENLSTVGSWLDRHPNMYVDTADRIAELGRQPYSTRKFFNRYRDRILLGTDSIPSDRKYPIYYRFSETWDEYFDYSDKKIPPQGRWKIYGLGLDDDVLEKFYYKNAERILCKNK